MVAVSLKKINKFGWLGREMGKKALMAVMEGSERGKRWVGGRRSTSLNRPPKIQLLCAEIHGTGTSAQDTGTTGECGEPFLGHQGGTSGGAPGSTGLLE